MRDNLKKYMMTFVLILIIPQIVSLMNCYMMLDKQLTELPMGVYIGDNTSLTRNIVNSFDNNETFDIKYYVQSPDDIERLMEKGSIVFGLVIPKDFTKDLKKIKSPTIVTVFDGTQLSSASFTKLKATEILLTTKTGAMVSAFKGKFDMSTREALNTARAININTKVIGNPTRNYIDFLLPGMMTALVQIGLAMSAAGAIVDKKNEKAIKYYLRKVSFYGSIGFLSTMMIILVQTVFFGVPFNGSFLEVMILSLLFNFAVSSIAVMISRIIKDRVFSAQVAAVFFIPSSILSGYTWPLIAMPEFFQNFSKILPFTYYGDTLRDILIKGESGFYQNSVVSLIVMIITSFIVTLVIEKFIDGKKETKKIKLTKVIKGEENLEYID
jgi:ABC-2 type transport system permease protein